MPVFTVSQCFPANTQRTWQNPTTGETVVFNNYNVQFQEMPGQTFQIGRTAKQQPPVPGQQLNGEMAQGRNGSYFKEQKQQQQGNFQRNGQGGGFQQRKFGGGGGNTGREIMAQCCLKEAVATAIAKQEFDPRTVEFYLQHYMEMCMKVAGMTVDAQVPVQQPAAQPAQQQPQQGYQQLPMNGGGYQQPANRVAQYTQQPQQQGFGGEFDQADVPF